MAPLLDTSLLQFPQFPRNEFKTVDRHLDTITNEDCIHAMKELPAGSVDFVLTDPPYITNYRDRQGRSIQNDNNGEWLFPAFQEMFRLLKQDAFCISFYGWNHADKFVSSWRECGFRPVGHFVWVKSYVSSVGYSKMCHECAYLLVKGRPQKPTNSPVDVLAFEYTGNKLHPTQKPVSGLIPLIEAYSAPGETVLDPFGGSGSTGVAARQCGRRFMLIEKDIQYFEAAQRRLAGSKN